MPIASALLLLPLAVLQPNTSPHARVHAPAGSTSRPAASSHTSRRTALAQSLLALPLLPSCASAVSVYAPGSAERCENGEGEACARLAGDSDLVKRLQEQSKKNRAKNERELFDKTVRNLQYSDYFDSLDKNLVQLPNSSYVVLDGETYSRLRKEGRIQTGSVDRLLPEGEKARAEFLSAAGDPNYVCSRGLSCRQAQTGFLDYSAFKKSLSAQQIEGVVFQPPNGDVLFALQSGSEQPLKVDVKGWKKLEAVNMLKRMDIPNNFEEFQ